MAVLLNNGRNISFITEAFKKIREYPHIISHYDTLWCIIESELSNLLKHHKDLTYHDSRDELLCKLLQKTDLSIYLKTPEIKKIIKFFDYSNYGSIIKGFNWFIKNIERGYNPTVAIISSAGKFFNKDNVDKIYAKYPNKIDIKSIISTSFLINHIFTTDNLQEINQIFSNYKFTQEDIKDILNNTIFIEFSVNTTFNNELNYIHRVISYKKEHNLTLNFKDIEHLSSYTCNILIKIYDKATIEKDEKCIQTLNNIKLICEKFTDDELINYIQISLNKAHIFSNKYIDIFSKYLNFNKISTENIHKLIAKLPHFTTKLPRELFNKIYTETNTNEFITTLIVNSQNNLVLEIINEPEKINCKLDDIFYMAFDFGNIPLIQYFLNNKYKITEEMILNNNSSNLLSILNECTKHGIYITEKCFEHLTFNMFISTGSKVNTKYIQQVSVYVNDDDEFNKFIPVIESKVKEYIHMEDVVLKSFNNIIEYLKTNKVTNELIVLSQDKRIKNYLISRMDKERSIKKVIVKKIVKKSKENI